MSTITDQGFPTLDNIMKFLDPDGSPARTVANTLTKKRSLLKDMPFKEGNLATGHRITSVRGLPSPTWRKLNQGINATKVEFDQYDESCGLLEDKSVIDVESVRLAGAGPDGAAYRAKQDMVKVESFGQTLSTALFYANIGTNPEQIHGLSQRYAATSGLTSSPYVLKPGTNSGSNCHSIWLINWDPDRVCGIYPKASQAGLEIEDMGRQLVLDSSGSKQFWAWVTRLVWRVGIAVEDYRYVVRMQWDPDDSTNFADSAKGMYLNMQDMLSTVYDLGPAARFYMDRTSLQKLQNQLASNDQRPLKYVTDPATGYGLAAANAGQVPTFEGVPIRLDDMLVAEAAIS